jgi:hypothetical protein
MGSPSRTTARGVSSSETRPAAGGNDAQADGAPVRAPRPRHAPLVPLQGRVAPRQGVGVLAVGLPQHRLKVLDGDRLGQEAERPLPAHGRGRVDAAVGRQHHHRHVGAVAAQLGQGGRPVHARHHVVEHDDVQVAVGPRQAQALLAAAGLDHVETAQDEALGQGAAELLLVVHEQDTGAVVRRVFVHRFSSRGEFQR